MTDEQFTQATILKREIGTLKILMGTWERAEKIENLQVSYTNDFGSMFEDVSDLFVDFGELKQRTLLAIRQRIDELQKKIS